ncbi:MAG: M20/M25/M40 family metallo-hydrolase [Actinomycetota bacterium]|nr:M20/M25/M40 family metallo-hydrolase [Actinomycetota bacterium]
MDAVDRAITDLAPRAFALLERMVARPSTVGIESDAQELLVAELVDAGFAVSRLPIPEDIGLDPAAGVPRQEYAGRYDVVGLRTAALGQDARVSTPRSLVINGHMDVVPADDISCWTSPPFEPHVRDGWMHGRGAGDMKGGFAAGLLALWALDAAAEGWLGGGTLTFVSAIEEEYTGNGTLAACHAGYLADAALLLEPTDLDLLLAGVSIIWVEIDVVGRSGHAEAAHRTANPILSCRSIIDALERFERCLNDEHANGPDADSVFKAIEHPYNVNVGAFHAGDWASSVPSTARIEVRVGHPRRWNADEAFEAVKAAVLEACADNEYLVKHPPRLRMSGFRAERYAQKPSGDLVETLVAAHRDAHGTEPGLVAMGSTTDARYYLNQFGVPAVAYGPRTRNIHGTDEAVELASIVDTARTVARFLATWFEGTGGEEG